MYYSILFLLEYGKCRYIYNGRYPSIYPSSYFQSYYKRLKDSDLKETSHSRSVIAFKKCEIFSPYGVGQYIIKMPKIRGWKDIWERQERFERSCWDNPFIRGKGLKASKIVKKLNNIRSNDSFLGLLERQREACRQRVKLPDRGNVLSRVPVRGNVNRRVPSPHCPPTTSTGADIMSFLLLALPLAFIQKSNLNMDLNNFLDFYSCLIECVKNALNGDAISSIVDGSEVASNTSETLSTAQREKASSSNDVHSRFGLILVGSLLLIHFLTIGAGQVLPI